MKSHKTSALKKSSSLRPKEPGWVWELIQQAWSSLEPKCTSEQKLKEGRENNLFGNKMYYIL